MRPGRVLSLVSPLLLVAVAATAQQQNRPASPRGTAATQVAGRWVQEKPDAPSRYVDGKWIEVNYGRPIKRGRDVFGTGANYGKVANPDAPVWRAGANQTTRLKTEVPLKFGDKTLPAGEYSVFVDLKENAWSLIFSNHTAQEKYDQNEKVMLWGAYGYDPKMDVLRTPMKMMKSTVSVDQFTIGFVDVTTGGGSLAMWWDKEFAVAPFTVAGS